jgi:hypothetical protein
LECIAVQIELSHGKAGLCVELPDDNLTIVELLFVPGLDDEEAAISDVLRHPLG